METENSALISPRPRTDHHVVEEGSDEESHLHSFDLESPNEGVGHGDTQFRSTSALEIMRETVRILRYNSNGFMAITALLICPVYGVFLSNVLVSKSLVKSLTIKLLLVAKASGFPLRHFIKQWLQSFVEMAVSLGSCFPLFITLSLLSKAAIVYSVDSTYSRKEFDASKFYVYICKIWKRLVSTYLWMCMVVVGCVTLSLVLLVTVWHTLMVLGVSFDLNLYATFALGTAFSIVFANAIVICNVAFVISVLEDVSGMEALIRSRHLIKGQSQVGLMLYLISNIGMAFIEWLFDHRVKVISYGDGSSRIWEGPLLVFMYSFVVLTDSMNSAVYYFSCRSYYLENLSSESNLVGETVTETEDN